MCTKNQALSILSQAYQRCVKIFSNKLSDAYLYGSYARGDFDDESDIDILVTVDMSANDLAEIRSQVSKINSDLSLEHDVTVSITAAPLEQFNKYINILPYYRNVSREGIKYAG